MGNVKWPVDLGKSAHGNTNSYYNDEAKSFHILVDLEVAIKINGIPALWHGTSAMRSQYHKKCLVKDVCCIVCSGKNKTKLKLTRK